MPNVTLATPHIIKIYSMNKREKTILSQIYKDCLKLKRQKQLTEYGKGQLDLIEVLLEVARS